MITKDGMVVYAVNREYPHDLPADDCVVSEFLRPGGDRLVIALPDIAPAELKALRFGEVRVGLLAEKGAILFIWQFSTPDGPVFTLDTPFDARLIDDIQLHSTDNASNRLLIDIHIVDSASKLTLGLRATTMPPGLTAAFLSAVQDQLCSSTGELQHKMWGVHSPVKLTTICHLWSMGT